MKKATAPSLTLTTQGLDLQLQGPGKLCQCVSVWRPRELEFRPGSGQASPPASYYSVLWQVPACLLFPPSPGNPAAFLVQAQTRPGGPDSTAWAGGSSQPSDHFFLAFVTEEFPFQQFRARGVGGPRAAGWVSGCKEEMGGEKRETLDIPFLGLFHPQIQGK